MANITFTIPDEHMGELIDAFASVYKYQEMIQDPDVSEPSEIPNPQSKEQFAKDTIRNHIRNTYIKYKAKIDAEAASAVTTTTASSIADTFIGS